MRRRIEGATLVLPTELVASDLTIDDGKIVQIGGTRGPVDEIIDATGLHVMPGLIDDQVHFRDPGLTHKEDLYSASRACAAGGVTTFLEMPNTVPNTTSQAVLEAKLSLASHKSVVNYGFYIGATTDNVGELKLAHRTPGIKIFIGSSTGNLLVDEQDALESIFANGSLPITAHCEDETTIRANRAAIGESTNPADHSRIRDVKAAVIATKRAMDLAFRHNRRFHVLHVSTGDETELFADHRGLITAEACPHHLFFSTDDYEKHGVWVQMNPSLKGPENPPRLWNALHDGRIQVIATDHAPHTKAEKSVAYPGAPSGVPAVENMLALLLNEYAAGRVTLNEIAGWTADAPARVWDIVDKGRIAEGYDADLVIVDLNKSRTVQNEAQHTKCGWSPWHGETLTGWPVQTIVGGHTVWKDGAFDTKFRGTEARYDHARGGYWATQST